MGAVVLRDLLVHVVADVVAVGAADALELGVLGHFFGEWVVVGEADDQDVAVFDPPGVAVDEGGGAAPDDRELDAEVEGELLEVAGHAAVGGVLGAVADPGFEEEEGFDGEACELGVPVPAAVHVVPA